MRFVCFNAQKRASIAQLAQAGEAVAFANVLMKKNRSTNAVEAQIQDNTTVAKSPKKIDLPNHVHSKTNVPKQITISQLTDEAPDQLVTVDAKVVEMSETTTLSTGSRAGSRIKKVVISDSTASCVLTLWNDFIQTVQLNQSYTFHSMAIKTFGDIRSLYTPQRNAAITPCTEISDVSPNTVTLTEKPTTAENVSIASVSDYVNYHLCPACNSGRITEVQNHLFPGAGRCSSCSTLTLMKNCQRSAYALLTLSAETSKLILSADASILTAIAQCPIPSLTEWALLNAPAFDVIYTRNKKIVRIERNDGASAAITTPPSSTASSAPAPAENITPSKPNQTRRIAQSTATRSLSEALLAADVSQAVNKTPVESPSSLTQKRQAPKNRKK